MAAEKFRFIVRDKVQDVGCRGFIIAEMLNEGFNKGTAINLPDGSVEVRIEGNELKVKEFVEKLKAKLDEKYGNPKVKIERLECTPDLEIPDIMHSSQAHLLLQFDKALEVLRGLPRGIAFELKDLLKG